jgi:hypothetical protein
MNEWTRVEDGLPERDGWVWVMCEDGVTLSEYKEDYYGRDNAFLNAYEDGYIIGVTHWRYADVPEPPKEQQ